MQFLYAVINFLILAAILFIFGRKTAANIFSTRRDRINRDLDEAEKDVFVEQEQFDVPTVEELCDKMLGDCYIASLEQAVAGDFKKAHDHTSREMHARAADTVTSVKDRTASKIADRVAEIMMTEEYIDRLRVREHEYAEKILEKIELTPGDMAYLRKHEVLYVTLTSAHEHELPDRTVDMIREKTQLLLDTVNGVQSFWVKVDPELIGGLRLRIGDTVYDCTVADNIYQLRKKLEEKILAEDATAEEIFDGLKKDIDNIEINVSEFQLGRVISVSDGICWLDGLADIMYGEVIEFECGELGMILDIQEDKIGCIVYGQYEHIESGSRVRRVGRIASVPVGEAMLGRVVDALGRAVDGKWNIRTNERRTIELRSPMIPDRTSVSRPMQTGIKAIDALIPIGKGQRELIIGDRQTGKSSIAVDAIINQKGKDVICIYVAIGQKDSTVAEIRDKLEKNGAMDYTTILSAPASSSASLQYIAPFSATAMGEYFMYSGRDVLIIYDDLSKHAVAYREISLLLHRPSGREAYPGDVFYLHSRLLERSAQLSEELGGGSMTALPIIETQAGDISAYIPTNVISITDGQIFLDGDIFNEGQKPAINVGLSVSRVGSAAQTKLMKQVSSNLRVRLAQYRELASFTQFGAEIDNATRATLDSGAKMMAALMQERYKPLPMWQQAVIIFAVSEKCAEGLTPDNVSDYEERLFEHLEDVYPELTDKLKSGEKMNSECIRELKSALCEVK